MVGIETAGCLTGTRKSGARGLSRDTTLRRIRDNGKSSGFELLLTEGCTGSQGNKAGVFSGNKVRGANEWSPSIDDGTEVGRAIGAVTEVDICSAIVLVESEKAIVPDGEREVIIEGADERIVGGGFCKFGEPIDVPR